MKLPHFLALLLASATFAADPRGDSPDAPPSTPQEQLAMFTVPPGFEVQLVADESQIQKPMNLNFDAAGRLWVTGSAMYPWPAKIDARGEPIPGFDDVWKNTAGSFDARHAPLPPERATDTVRVLSDFGPDGGARKVETFADGLNIPMGVQPLPRKPGAKGDSVIVFSIPTIWRLEDSDGDGRADEREPLYTGFDFKDTHGMSSNYLYWIDGWIYGCHGFRNHSEVRDRAGNVTVFDSGNTYRFRPDGSKIEVHTHGQTNPFGLTVDPLGNFFSADSHSKPVMLLQRGGFYAGIGKKHDGLGFAPTITDDDHGSSAIAGIAYYAAEQFPAEFRDNLFNGNPVTRRINRARLGWHGATPKAIRMPDFLSCDDPWFRPIQVKLGPDGALYIADFYNPIIGHYEFPLADPRRDRSHGRIWRVVWRGEAAAPGSALVPSAGDDVPPSRTSGSDVSPTTSPLRAARSEVRRGETPRPAFGTSALPGVSLPDLTQLDANGLIEKLADPNLVVRTLATNELADRVDKESAADALEAAYLRGFPDRAPHRELALWISERLGRRVDVRLLAGFANAPVSVHAMKILADRPVIDQRELDILERAAQSDDKTIVRASAEVFSRHPVSYHLGTMLGAMNRTPPDDPALRYAVRMALRNILAAPGGSQRAEKIATDFPYHGKILADVSLGTPTPDAADFLLGHLRRDNLRGARGGEFLRHAVLHLPQQKLSAISALVDAVKDASLPQRLDIADNIANAFRERGLPLPDDLGDWTRRTLLEALASTDAATLNRAIAAVRDVAWDGKSELLRRIVFDPHAPGPRRAAALEAMMNCSAGRAAAIEALADPASPPLRRKAAELLGQESNPGLVPREGAARAGAEARAALASALPTAPADLAVVVAAGLAKTEAGSSALLDLISQGRATPSLLRQRTVATAFGKNPAPLRDRAATLTENLPPEDERLATIIAERAQTYGKAKPDPARGAPLFAQHCAVCHRFRNEGGNVGPSLDGVAARGPARLIEDILDPNRNVDPLFRQTTIETTTGDIHVGANLRDQGDTVLLADLTGREVTIPKSAIKTRTPSALSLMPSVYETAIPAADFLDLIAFLLRPATGAPPGSSR